MEIKYRVVNTTSTESENYNIQDATLAGEYTVFTKFNPATDFIEARYEIDGEQISYVESYTNYRIVSDSEYTTESGVSRLTINPQVDIIALDYTVPEISATYSFYRNLFNTRDRFQKLYIDSISDDRTELRLRTFNIANTSLLSIVNDIRNSLRTNPNFSDFKILLSDGRTLLAINIDSQKVGDDQSVIIKLYNPLPTDIQEKEELQVVSEVSDPQTFLIFTDIEPTPPSYIKLAGANFSRGSADLETGTEYLASVDLINVNTYSSDILEALSKSSENSILIGIEYSHLGNFIHFSSAVERLKNFVYKTQLVEGYKTALSALPTGSSIRESKEFYETSIQNTVRNFDHFERYLYFDSGSNTWPKRTDVKPYVLFSSTSSAAINWYSSYLSECETYDNTNYYRLTNTLPDYLREDSENENLVVFVDMLGQHFDNIKIYSDTLAKKYDTDNRVNRGLASSLIEPVLENFGVKLHTNNFKSTQDLFKYFILTDDSVDSEIINTTSSLDNINVSEESYRQELYKRVYHNLPLLLKTKGTERGLKVLMSTFGIPSNIFPVKTYGSTSFKNTPYFGFESPNESGSIEKIRLDHTGSIEGTVLASNTSIQKRDSDYLLDLHVIEVGPSPNDNINRYILENISGSFNIDQYIGDPRGTNKLDLDKVKQDILGDLERYDLKDFIRLIRFYDNTFFRMVRDFAPGRDIIDSGIIIKPHILEHNLVKDFSVEITDETLQTEVDTAFITGSDGGVFGSKSNYITSYTETIQYPDGLTTKPKNQNGYTLVGRHDGEAPRYTGEFSGSVIKGAEKELNKDNVFKKPIFFNSFYNITPIIDLATIPPAPTTTTTTSTTTTTTSTTTTTTTATPPYVSNITASLDSDISSIGDVRVSYTRVVTGAPLTVTLSDTNVSGEEDQLSYITNAQTGSNAITAQVNKYSSGTTLEVGTGAAQPYVQLIVNVNGSDIFNQTVNTGNLTVNHTFDHDPGDDIWIQGIISTD
jgi:hypothetical protein